MRIASGALVPSARPKRHRGGKKHAVTIARPLGDPNRGECCLENGKNLGPSPAEATDTTQIPITVMKYSDKDLVGKKSAAHGKKKAARHSL